MWKGVYSSLQLLLNFFSFFQGAIPKRPRVSDQSNKHPSDATDSNEDLTKDEDYDKTRFNNRKTQKRRPPTPPTSVSGGATAGSHADVVAASNDLRQRILEILGNFIKCRVDQKSYIRIGRKYFTI